jgi:CubicO group peptidase (beta-lactamase class C family)
MERKMADCGIGRSLRIGSCCAAIAFSLATLIDLPEFCRTIPAAQTSRPDPVRNLDSLLGPIIKSHDIPGMTAAIVEHDRIVAIGAAGVRRRGSANAVTLRDTFHLGSCTKAMTATMIASLVEQGLLDWSTTVSQAFPELTQRMDPRWRSATLQQLLTHRSGAPADLNAGGLWQRLWAHADRPPVEQRRELVEAVLTEPPAAEPGTAYIYSNAGYAIAGAMAESVTKIPWEQLMRSRIFEPLGMTSAGFGPPGDQEWPDEPRGHRPDGEPIEPGMHADNPAAIGPAGTVHCTISDWARFVALHLQAARGDARLLKLESFTRLHAPPQADDEQYAMGWLIRNREWANDGDGGGVLTHNGSNTMWFCVTWIAPEKDFAVLVMCNQGGEAAARSCDDAAWTLIQEQLRKTGVETTMPASAPASRPAHSP